MKYTRHLGIVHKNYRCADHGTWRCSGLVIPPRIAPVQTMIIPIAQHKEGVLDKANELVDTLKAAGYKVKIDDSDKAPGWKFSGQEILGIPTRIEIGPKDIENNQAVIVRRDTREKIVVSLDELTTKLAEVLGQCRMICITEQKHSLTLISMKQQQWTR